MVGAESKYRTSSSFGGRRLCQDVFFAGRRLVCSSDGCKKKESNKKLCTDFIFCRTQFAVGRTIMHALGLRNFDSLVVVLCETLGDADCKRTHFAGRPVNQYHSKLSPFRTRWALSLRRPIPEFPSRHLSSSQPAEPSAMAALPPTFSGISWKSNHPNIASIRGSGIAHGKKGGSVTISATASGVTGSTSLKVGTGTLISLVVTPVSPTAAAGGPQQFVGTGTFSDASTQDITLNAHWSSSHATVATIANAPSVGGQANCIAAGTTIIGANSGGTTGSSTLTVQ